MPSAAPWQLPVLPARRRRPGPATPRSRQPKPDHRSAPGHQRRRTWRTVESGARHDAWVQPSRANHSLLLRPRRDRQLAPLEGAGRIGEGDQALFLSFDLQKVTKHWPHTQGARGHTTGRVPYMGARPAWLDSRRCPDTDRPSTTWRRACRSINDDARRPFGAARVTSAKKPASSCWGLDDLRCPWAAGRRRSSGSGTPGDHRSR